VKAEKLTQLFYAACI